MIEYVPYRGWKNNLLLANRSTEIIVTLDVGPRVISYRTQDGPNIFKNYERQMGHSDEGSWQIRGGHRFWLAPEDEVLSYIPDNSAVEHRILSPWEVEFTRPPSRVLPVEMKLVVKLDPESSRVSVTHLATNGGAAPRTLATWGLTVLAPGGTEIIPLPPLGEHPRDLLPARQMILWPYTDMTDHRWHWGKRFVTLRQEAESAPTKLGLGHREGWAAYALADQLFLKTIPWQADVAYPDLGCNFETFSNHEMLELEALGPLVTLATDESTGHTEHWDLLPTTGVLPAMDDEGALADWLRPMLDQIGMQAGRAQD